MTVSRVQYKHVYTGTSGAFTSNVTAGNLIVVFTMAADGSSADAVCSDSLGNTYTKSQQLRASRSNLSVWYAYNVTGGACTITAYGGASDRGFTAIEYSSSNGSWTSDPLSDSSINSASGSGSSPFTTSATLSATGILVCGWSDETKNLLTGWTSNLTQIQKDSGQYDGTADGLNLAAGTYNEGGTFSTTPPNSTIICLAAFNEPTGGGGGSSIKTINGLAYASIKTVNDLALASVKTVNGLA